MNKIEIGSEGLGLPGLLFLIFLILKLTDAIDWSWWWVFSPLWITGIIGILFFVFVILITWRD